MKEQTNDLMVGDAVRVRTWSGFARGEVERVGRRDGKVVVRLESGGTTKAEPDRIEREARDVPTDHRGSSESRYVEPRSVRTSLGSVGIVSSPKTSTLRDRDYLDWLRSRSCVCCGFDGGCDPSHHGRGGVGLKAGDDMAVSLCRRCHDHWHQHGKLLAKLDWSKDKTMRWLKAHSARLYAEFKTTRSKT